MTCLLRATLTAYKLSFEYDVSDKESHCLFTSEEELY